MEFSDIVLVCLLVLAIRSFLNFVQAAEKVKELQEEAVDEIEKELKRLIPVKVEVHHDCYYFFHQLTDEFVVQGHNKDEVAAALNARYGNSRKIAVDTDDPVIKQFLGNDNLNNQVI